MFHISEPLVSVCGAHLQLLLPLLTFNLFFDQLIIAVSHKAFREQHITDKLGLSLPNIVLRKI